MSESVRAYELQAQKATPQEWLPSWEEIERRAADGRSGAGSVITDVRRRIAASYLTLLEALADACLIG